MQQAFVKLRRGETGQLPPPVENMHQLVRFRAVRRTTGSEHVAGSLVIRRKYGSPPAPFYVKPRPVKLWLTARFLIIRHGYISGFGLAVQVKELVG